MFGRGGGFVNGTQLWCGFLLPEYSLPFVVYFVVFLVTCYFIQATAIFNKLIFKYVTRTRIFKT